MNKPNPVRVRWAKVKRSTSRDSYADYFAQINGTSVASFGSKDRAVDWVNLVNAELSRLVAARDKRKETT